MPITFIDCTINTFNFSAKICKFLNGDSKEFCACDSFVLDLPLSVDSRWTIADLGVNDVLESVVVERRQFFKLRWNLRKNYRKS